MKTCHGAERKTSSWAGPNWCLMKDMGPGGKRISGPGGAGGWGQADGEQLGPDTHSWRHGASGAGAIGVLGHQAHHGVDASSSA